MVTDTQHAIENIKNACKNMGINDMHTQVIISQIIAYIPIESIFHLPSPMLTGFMPIDYLLYPIYPNFRINIYGRQGSGKTSIIAHIVASIAAKYNVKVLWIDSSFRISPKYMKKIHDGIEVLQSSSITQEILNLISLQKYAVIVIDDTASFKRTSIAFLERLLFMCKRIPALVLCANQVREKPGTGIVYASTQELMLMYSATLRVTRYKKNVQQNYNDYDMKLEYNQSEGRMEGKSVVVPISTSGFIKDYLMNKRISAILESDGYKTIHEMAKARYNS